MASTDEEKENTLIQIGREFLLELQELAELEEEGGKSTRINLIRILDTQDQKWVELSKLTEGKIPQDGFQFLIRKAFKEIFVIWALKKSF